MEPKSTCSKQKNNLKKHFFSHDGEVVVFHKSTSKIVGQKLVKVEWSNLTKVVFLTKQEGLKGKNNFVTFSNVKGSNKTVCRKMKIHTVSLRLRETV